jgi:hypothetical protein
MTACSSPAPDGGAGSQPGSSPTAGASAPNTTAPAGAPTGAASQRPSAAPTTKNQPVPKVERSGGGTSAPTVKAKPTSIDGTVKYSDGVRLGITDVQFGKETDKGPGAFPGREYAILSLAVENSSDKALSMQTVVVTVLDSKNAAVSPVYVAKAKVQDFSGSLKPGKTAKARYAFAVPKKSRDKVTVVVDFDGVHTSAVFRGELN